MARARSNYSCVTNRSQGGDRQNVRTGQSVLPFHTHTSSPRNARAKKSGHRAPELQTVAHLASAHSSLLLGRFSDLDTLEKMCSPTVAKTPVGPRSA